MRGGERPFDRTHDTKREREKRGKREGETKGEKTATADTASLDTQKSNKTSRFWSSIPLVSSIISNEMESSWSRMRQKNDPDPALVSLSFSNSTQPCKYKPKRKKCLVT